LLTPEIEVQDFPAWALAPYGVEAQSPDRFLTDLLLGAPARMTRAVVAQAAALTRPPRTPGEVLDALAPWAPEFVARVRPSLLGPP
jgi:hypothetical protein